MPGDTLIINTNPLLNLVHTGRFVPGAINRVAGLAMHAEGKGVNVARVLARLGHAVTLTGFAGGHSGAWLRELIRNEGIEDAFVQTAAPVRVGFMASSGQGEHPTTVLPNGFPVNGEECARLLEQTRQRLAGARLAIISGSVPDLVANGLYTELLDLCRAAGVPCWLDAHGAALQQALAGPHPPQLAKPNREEHAQSARWDAVAELHITDGAAPVRVERSGRPAWRVTPPPIRQVNPVGSGDCYLAGLAHGWLRGWPPAERLRFASAAGAANARRQDVALIEPGEVEDLLDAVVVEDMTRNGATA